MKKIKFITHIHAIIKLSFILILISACLLLANCENKKQDLHIVIKDGNAKEITGDTVQVSLNSIHQTLIEVVSLSTTPRYLRQLDQGDIESLNGHKDYELISHGMNADGSNFQKVVITTSFSDTLMHIGSIVKISARIDTDLVESVFYKVDQ